MIDLVYPVDKAIPLIPSGIFQQAGRKRKHEREILPVVQEDGLVVARADRDYCHGGSCLLHPVVHLHIIGRDGRIYLQKRSAGKDLYPGKWDTAVGGHIAYGESVMEALFREASEELGLREFNPSFLETYRYESPSECELVSVFAAAGTFEPEPDAEEVEEGRWWTPKEIEKELRSGIFTPVFQSEFKKIRRKLFSIL